MNTNEILDAYRAGDEYQRMCLFLYHRTLRDAFERIEDEEIPRPMESRMCAATVYAHAPVLDEILELWRNPLGNDFVAYRNHCYRVLNFCLAFCGGSPLNIRKVSIAAAFHDLGIWAANTYDYLGPSRRLARDDLEKRNLASWRDEIETMIEIHHKILAYGKKPAWLVEPFRKADWIDISRGMLRHGLPSSFLAEVLAAFPNEGC